MINTNDRISIQVGLSGYSFKVRPGGDGTVSEWMPTETIFTEPQMQRRYADVCISVFTPLCTIVPENFHKPELSAEILSDMVKLPKDANVNYVSVPEFNAVVVYSDSIGGTFHKVVSESVLRVDGSRAEPLPEMYDMLKDLQNIEEYNKVIASYMDGVLYLAIAQGSTLMLCNTYPAPDFTTAEYFIFLAMKKLQLNPEVSTIYFRTILTEDQELSLYRYFKSVDHI